jgi:hypothetical protein
VLTAALALVLVPVAFGFLFREASSKTLVVDLRALPSAADLTKRTAENPPGIPPIVIASPAQLADSCAVASPLSNPAYCTVINKDPITLITDGSLSSTPEVLQKSIGTDSEINGAGAFWETTTAPTGFNPIAALVTFAVTAALATGVLLRTRRGHRSPNRVPAMREAIPASLPQQNHLPQPQMAGAHTAAGTPPPRQPARSGQSPRSVAAELTPLVTRAGRRAVARTHVDARGGYVEVGDVVVWAVLPPTEQAVVVPDDELDVLGVDEKTETLVVAPTGSPSPGRRPRP